MKCLAVIFCAVLSVAVAAEDAEIARNLKVCSRDSEDYQLCLKDAIQDALAKLIRGVPEWGVPVLDPYLTEAQDTEYGNGFIYGKMSIRDVNTYGTSRAQILSAKAISSEDRHRLEVDVAFPKIFIEGQYKAEGRLNDFKVGGKGYFNVSMEGIRTGWDITGRIENDRWVVEHFRMLPEVEKLKVYFDDLFNGDEAINTAARNFINEYWPLFYRELMPVAAVEWDKQMTEFVNLIFSRIPYSKVFP